MEIGGEGSDTDSTLVEGKTNSTFCFADPVELQSYVWWSSYRKSLKQPAASAILQNIKAVAAGSGYVLALKQNGELYTWGENRPYSLNRPM